MLIEKRRPFIGTPAAEASGSRYPPVVIIVVNGRTADVEAPDKEGS